MSDEATTGGRRPSEFDLLRDEMRAGFQSMRDRFDGVDKRFDGIDRRLDEHDTRFVSLETWITESETATRRHFDIVAEGLRADMKIVIDQNTTTGKKLDRLITRNAIEHAAILDAVTDHHEVRITSLENAAGTTKPPSR